MRSARGLMLFGACLAVLPACGGCEETQGMDAERVRVWGRDKLAQDIQAKADERLDPNGLDADPTLARRILSMSFAEVTARLGFTVYTGKAKFSIERNGKSLDVIEDTTIERGRNGSYRVVQKDDEGVVLRETVYNNGVYYVRNGPGKLRVQGIRPTETTVSLEEAFEPLRAYTAYYGPRLGLRRAGSATIQGRPAMKYELVLLEGSELVAVPGMKGKKKPVSVKGAVFVDAETGAPIGAKLKGRLDLPPAPPKPVETSTSADAPPPPPPPKTPPKWGHLDLALDYEIRVSDDKEIKPKDYVPTITRRPIELDPTAFLDGGTRTSTIIGGPR